MAVKTKFCAKIAIIIFFLFYKLETWCQAKDSSYYYVTASYDLYKEDSQQALAYLQKAEEFLEKFPNDSLEAVMLKNYAAVYYVKGQYAKSFKYTEKALARFRAMNDLYNVSLAYNGLGLAQQALEDTSRL